MEEEILKAINGLTEAINNLATKDTSSWSEPTIILTILSLAVSTAIAIVMYNISKIQKDMMEYQHIVSIYDRRIKCLEQLKAILSRVRIRSPHFNLKEKPIYLSMSLEKIKFEKNYLFDKESIIYIDEIINICRLSDHIIDSLWSITNNESFIAFEVKYIKLELENNGINLDDEGIHLTSEIDHDTAYKILLVVNNLAREIYKNFDENLNKYYDFNYNNKIK